MSYIKAMKNSVLTCMVLWGVLCPVWADYFPVGTTWTEVVTNPCGDVGARYDLFTYTVGCNVTVDGKSYRLVYCNGENAQRAIREEGQKVFLYDFGVGEECLAWDFDWAQGKEVCHETFYWTDCCETLTEIKSMTLADGSHGDYIERGDGEMVIQGIGYTGGIFSECYPFGSDGSKTELLSFIRDGMELYHRPRVRYSPYRQADDSEKQQLQYDWAEMGLWVTGVMYVKGNGIHYLHYTVEGDKIILEREDWGNSGKESYDLCLVCMFIPYVPKGAYNVILKPYGETMPETADEQFITGVPVSEVQSSPAYTFRYEGGMYVVEGNGVFFAEVFDMSGCKLWEGRSGNGILNIPAVYGTDKGIYLCRVSGGSGVMAFKLMLRN